MKEQNGDGLSWTMRLFRIVLEKRDPIFAISALKRVGERGEGWLLSEPSIYPLYQNVLKLAFAGDPRKIASLVLGKGNLGKSGLKEGVKEEVF